MFGEQIFRMVLGLLVGVWVARYLGPEQFGMFSYAIAFVSIFGSFAKLGLDGILVRDLVNTPQKRDVYLGTAFGLKIIGALVAMFIVVTTTIFTSRDYSTNLYIFIIACGILFQSAEVIDFYFQSKVLSKFVSLCKIIQLLFSSIMKIYLVLTDASLFWFVLVILIDQVTLAISLFIAYGNQKLGHFYNCFNWRVAKKMLNDSWPLMLSTIAVIIYMRIDQVMIQEMLGNEQVGLYSAALRLSEVWYFIPVLITNSLFPALAKVKRNNEVIYLRRLQLLFNGLTWIAIIVSIPMVFFSGYIIKFLYGEAFMEAQSVLVIHICGLVFVSIGVATNAYLIVEGFAKSSLYRTLLGVVVNISLNLILIPRYGINGSAIATVLSQFMANFIYDIFDAKVRMLFYIKVKAFFAFGYIFTRRSQVFNKQL